MSSCYLDANLLIYLQNKVSKFHSQTKLLIQHLIQEGFEIVISSLVLDEYFYNILRLMQGERVEKLENLRKEFRKILKIPKLKFINPPLQGSSHLKVLNLMKKHNLKPRDAYHLFMMKENRIKYLATFDNDFTRVFDTGIIKKFE